DVTQPHYVVFFFQAEDGIRDWSVTGVQTCALPILELSTPLTFVKGVGPGRATMLEAKGLVTVEDLLGYVPFRYEDRSNVKTIARSEERRVGKECRCRWSPNH